METLETKDPIDYWLELNRKAMWLKPKKYQQWQFIVGLSGSLEERIKLGQRALEMLKPQGGSLLTQVNESRKAYENEQVQRGSADDFMASLEDRVLEVVRRHIG